MRVTGGQSRGARLLGPGRGLAIRPTPDRIRGTLFDVLRARDRLHGQFCDVYAGTGAVGIDALSHGFAVTTFIDNSERACRIIRHNLDRLGYGDRGKVICSDARSALDRLAEGKVKFSVIFVDPPYQAGLVTPTMNKLGQGQITTSDAMVFVQHSRKEQLSPQIGYLSLVRVKEVGDTLLSMFCPGTGPDPEGG